jgi:hypothetical protein
VHHHKGSASMARHTFGGTRKEVPAYSLAVCGHRCRWLGSIDGRSADVGAAAPCDPALMRASSAPYRLAGRCPPSPYVPSDSLRRWRQ